MTRIITPQLIGSFGEYLVNEEKARATVAKYLHDVEEFRFWLGKQELCKSTVLSYKAYLCDRYAPTSVNAALASLNSFWGIRNGTICVSER